MKTAIKISRPYVQKLIRELNKYCFFAGSESYAESKGIKELTPEAIESVLISKEDYIEFSAHVNWSYKKAQKIIIRNRLRIERAIKAGTIEYEEPYTEHYILSLLRDYADCIAWVMLQNDISAIRNVFLEPRKPTNLDDQNWESIEHSLAYFNKDPYQFALATDLTSFFQTGDLYCINTRKGERYKIEVKTGEVNDKILDAIQSNEEGFKKKTLEMLEQSKNPDKTFKQIQRSLRQLQRATITLTYGGWGADKRTDLRTGKGVTIYEDSRDEESWSAAVRDVLKEIKNGGYATGWVDYCLFFAYGKKCLTNIDEMFFRHRINEHFKLGLSEEAAQHIPIFRSQMMLGTPTIRARSMLFANHLGMERQKKLMAGEEFLLVYLDAPSLQYMLNEHGFELKLRNMKEEDQPYADKMLSNLFGQNKVPVVSATVDGHYYEWTILSGTWNRIIFDFMAPIEIVNYSGSIIENTEKTQEDSTRSAKKKKSDE